MKHPPKVILLIPSAREYDRGVLRGVVEYAHIHGPWTFYEEPPPYLQAVSSQHRLARMQEWQADGLIALQNRMAEVRALRLPTVIVVGTRRLRKNQLQLVSDNKSIGRMAAEYLLGLGLRHFAYCGLAGMEWSENRRSAFCARIGEAGRTVQAYSAPRLGPGESWYMEEMQLGNWLEALPRPVGLLACNDDRARMIAEICRMRHIQVPDDVAILGVDNDEHVCLRATPPLSSVALATERGGYQVAGLLDRLMSGGKIATRQVLVHPTHVVTRQSTDLIAINDPNLVRGLRFIRQNSNRIIHMRDVAQAAGLSRRVLQDRFRLAMGRTVLEEINHTRTEHICRLLTETNLPVSEIASAIGYDEDAHISRFFSRQTGMTPLQYRRKNRKA